MLRTQKKPAIPSAPKPSVPPKPVRKPSTLILAEPYPIPATEEVSVPLEQQSKGTRAVESPYTIMPPLSFYEQKEDKT